jgi:hypothetical protein
MKVIRMEDDKETGFVSNKTIRKNKNQKVCEFCGRKINKDNHRIVDRKQICSYEESVIFFEDD